jgi:hypothetical protein
MKLPHLDREQPAITAALMADNEYAAFGEKTR